MTDNAFRTTLASAAAKLDLANALLAPAETGDRRGLIERARAEIKLAANELLYARSRLRDRTDAHP